MHRASWLALVPFCTFCMVTLLFARPADEASSRPSLENLTVAIQAELESHGDRVVGRNLYQWNTRLENINNCRAELSVRMASNTGGASETTESVKFSLGAIERYSIDLQKRWLELPCANHEKCIFSTSTCGKKTKDVIVMDCTTASQKQVDSFRLEYDGDAAAGRRLQKAFREAVEVCHEPKPVSF